jgi:hypothetical protein
MMEVCFQHAKQLRAIGEALNDLVHDVNLSISREGVSIQAMDTSHVCLIDVLLHAEDDEVFDRFACGEGDGATLGVHIPNLVRALRCAGPDDSCTLRCAGADADLLTLEFVSRSGAAVSEATAVSDATAVSESEATAVADRDAGDAGGEDAAVRMTAELADVKLGKPSARKPKAPKAPKAAKDAAASETVPVAVAVAPQQQQQRSAKFELKLMVIDADAFELPDRDDAACFRMPSKEFARAVKDLAGVGDVLRLSIVSVVSGADAQTTLTMSCAGDMGKASIAFQSADPEGAAKNGVVKPMSFSLKHLVSVSKACPLADEVVLDLVGGMPVCVTFGTTRRSSVRFYLAPKIDDEEEEDEDEDDEE